MAKQPKAKANAYGQQKTERFQVLFTADGLNILDALAAKLGVSRSEFLERSSRWVASNWSDEKLHQCLGSKANDQS